MKGLFLFFLICSIADAADVEVKVLKTTSKTNPHERKLLEKKLSKKINRPKASGTFQR